MWIVWTYIPGLAWAGWIHAGLRAGYNKYFIIAALYGIPFAMVMVFSESQPVDGHYSAGYNAAMSLNMIAWIGGIIHAQKAKKEVNLRIKYAAQAPATRVDHDLERRIAAEYGAPPVVTAPPQVRSPIPQARAAATKPQQVAAVPVAAVPEGVDVNSASEQEIAAIPGVGPILAKKAIKFRQSQRPFQTVEEFAQVLGLKPHVVEQVRRRVVVSSSRSVQAPQKQSGRVVDF